MFQFFGATKPRTKSRDVNKLLAPAKDQLEMLAPWEHQALDQALRHPQVVCNHRNLVQDALTSGNQEVQYQVPRC